jgi:hypothetical protein
MRLYLPTPISYAHSLRLQESFLIKHFAHNALNPERLGTDVLIFEYSA